MSGECSACPSSTRLIYFCQKEKQDFGTKTTLEQMLLHNAKDAHWCESYDVWLIMKLSAPRHRPWVRALLHPGSGRGQFFVLSWADTAPSSVRRPEVSQWRGLGLGGYVRPGPRSAAAVWCDQAHVRGLFRAGNEKIIHMYLYHAKHNSSNWRRSCVDWKMSCLFILKVIKAVLAARGY